MVFGIGETDNVFAMVQYFIFRNLLKKLSKISGQNSPH